MPSAGADLSGPVVRGDHCAPPRNGATLSGDLPDSHRRSRNLSASARASRNGSRPSRAPADRTPSRTQDAGSVGALVESAAPSRSARSSQCGWFVTSWRSSAASPPRACATTRSARYRAGSAGLVEPAGFIHASLQQPRERALSNSKVVRLAGGVERPHVGAHRHGVGRTADPSVHGRYADAAPLVLGTQRPLPLDTDVFGQTRWLIALLFACASSCLSARM